ncbi:KV1 protein, partial [Rostratula benghalensis]|nr:KV1 protein [Rostratula benghalensis]
GGTSALGRWIRGSRGQLWVSPGETAELSCDFSGISPSVNWYKEKPDGSLYWIYESFNNSRPKGKYSGKRGKEGKFSLAISSVQREDSGVYYCSSYDFYPSFGNGTRLIVTNATEPQLSILVPVDADPLGKIPLLCHLRDLPLGWDTVLWQPGGEKTEVTAVTMDEQGVLSAWSITWVSAKQW